MSRLKCIIKRFVRQSTFHSLTGIQFELCCILYAIVMGERSAYFIFLVSLSMQLTTAKTDNFHNKVREFGSVPFEDCGSLCDIQHVNISSCRSIPCEMPRGSVVLVNVIFDDKGRNIRSLKNNVRWVFNSIKTNAVIIPDPCKGSEECIVSIKGGKSYWTKVAVSKTLPIVRGVMLWQTVDEHNQEVICFKVPVTIRY